MVCMEAVNSSKNEKSGPDSGACPSDKSREGRGPDCKMVGGYPKKKNQQGGVDSGAFHFKRMTEEGWKDCVDRRLEE